jgi:hypothetical protein
VSVARCGVAVLDHPDRFDRRLVAVDQLEG